MSTMAAMEPLEIPVKTEIPQIKEESLKMSPTDSLSLAIPPPGAPSNASRRPPRKSTLTQQQKNQKRQRATQDQLGTLELEFEKNPTPTAAVRETIAQEINMTERSVQIWFQNRRAKIKNMAKKSIETGEDCDAIPESMRKYLAMQAFESGKPLVRDMANGIGIPGYGGLMLNSDSNSKVLIAHLACRSLTIGTWRRISQTALDLVVFYSPAKSMMTYYINADASGFKIEYPFSIIKNITLDSGNPSGNESETAQQMGGLVVELLAPPTFSMDNGSGGWFTCRDFTEDSQASQVMQHHLGGPPKVLSGQLAKLVSLESFRARHMQHAVQSAPVSPQGINRPASQPNHLVHPHSQAFQEQAFHMGPPAPRGHKRQRSRSVPVAVDFAQLRQPMQPFMMTHDIPPHIIHHHHHIFAPVPQSMPQTPHAFLPPNADPNAGYFVPAGPPAPPQMPPPGLSIDTSHAQDFNPEFHKPMPLSATTANSAAAAAAEFEPNFYSAGPQSDSFSATHLHTPYQTTFLSPMVDPSTVGTQPTSPFHANSPLSIVSHHGDPVIANQSPPLGGYDVTNSNDVFTLTPHEEGFTEDSFNFNEMFGKPSIQLPFRSPMEAAQEDFDFQSMIHFGGGDASSLSPENVENFGNST